LDELSLDELSVEDESVVFVFVLAAWSLLVRETLETSVLFQHLLV
jgi:hypothetical protein